MIQVVNFNTLVEINQLLKDKGIEYSFHSIGGCASCGLELRQDGEEHSIEDIINIANKHLSQQWLVIDQDENNPLFFYVKSKF